MKMMVCSYGKTRLYETAKGDLGRLCEGLTNIVLLPDSGELGRFMSEVDYRLDGGNWFYFNLSYLTVMVREMDVQRLCSR